MTNFSGIANDDLYAWIYGGRLGNGVWVGTEPHAIDAPAGEEIDYWQIDRGNSTVSNEKFFKVGVSGYKIGTLTGNTLKIKAYPVIINPDDKVLESAGLVGPSDLLVVLSGKDITNRTMILEPKEDFVWYQDKRYTVDRLTSLIAKGVTIRHSLACSLGSQRT